MEEGGCVCACVAAAFRCFWRWCTAGQPADRLALPHRCDPPLPVPSAGALAAQQHPCPAQLLHLLMQPRPLTTMTTPLLRCCRLLGPRPVLLAWHTTAATCCMVSPPAAAWVTHTPQLITSMFAAVVSTCATCLVQQEQGGGTPMLASCCWQQASPPTGAHLGPRHDAAVCGLAQCM